MKKAIYAIIACIIIAGIAITIFMGLNFDLRYTANKQLDIKIGKQFESEEIKQLVREVLENNNARVIVQKVEIYEDMVSIIVQEISDEQIEKLNAKINEKYEIDNKVEDVTVVINSKLRGRDLAIPYLWPIAISMLVVLVYSCMMYRRLGIVKVVAKILGFTILAQLVYLGLIAITRLPVTAITVPIALVIYVMTFVVVFLRLDKANKKILEDNEK